jgi:hypothetical protein
MLDVEVDLRGTTWLILRNGKAGDSPVDRMRASHGNRSSSVSGMPFDILSTFEWGCRVSPSIKGICNALERPAPIVDFPLTHVSLQTTKIQITHHDAGPFDRSAGYARGNIP